MIARAVLPEKIVEVIDITKEKLKQYRKIISDISVLETEIGEMEEGDGCSGDVILDYSTGQGIPQGIYGFDWKTYNRKKALLAKKRKEAETIRDWIEAIEDGQTRIVFKLRYIDGCSWLRIAKKIGMPHREDYVRLHICEDYLKKVGKVGKVVL